MDPDRLDALRSNALFEGIPDERLEGIIHDIEVVSYAAREVIFEENDPGDYTYLIISGEVCISKRRGKDKQDHQEILAHLTKCDFFGEMAVFDPAPRSARAVAVLPSTLGRMDREGMDRLSQAAPVQLAENLTRGAIRRLRDANARHIQEMVQAERLSAVGAMASTIIHDLRDPLNRIWGAASLLEQGTDPQRVSHWVGVIRSAGTRMLELTQDLLEYSRGGVINPRPITLPIDELLDDLRSEVLDDLERKGYEIRVRVGYRGRVELDWSRFRRVLVNILNNARDAMREGGAITLSIDRSDGVLQFSISDEGHGIPETVRARIFEPFFTHGKAGGTGLGMSISLAIVEAHGGTIDVESTPDEGSCFTIRIPQPVPTAAGTG